MGNTVITRKYRNKYIAYIYISKILSKTKYESLYEFGGIDSTIQAILNKYKYIDTVNVIYYGKKSKLIYIDNYTDMKQLKVISVESLNMQLTLIVLNEIKQMLKWTKNHKIKLIRPRTIVKCTKNEYLAILGHLGNGIVVLEKTEASSNMYIIYKKKKEEFIICSDDINANIRVKRKIKIIKDMYNNGDI
jgi:hypothetical protein